MAKSKKSEVESTEPKVHCSFNELVDPKTMKPHPRNPNTHSREQIEMLAKIIAHQGWRAPITVSDRSGFVVRGHARLEAGLRLGCSVVPVDKQHYNSEESELADLVADNKIAEFAEIDNGILRSVLDDLNRSAAELIELAGFTAHEFDALMATMVPEEPSFDPEPLPPPEYEGEDDRSGRFLLVYTCDEERDYWCQRLGFPPDFKQVIVTVEDAKKHEAEQ